MHYWHLWDFSGAVLLWSWKISRIPQGVGVPSVSGHQPHSEMWQEVRLGACEFMALPPWYQGLCNGRHVSCLLGSNAVGRWGEVGSWVCRGFPSLLVMVAASPHLSHHCAVSALVTGFSCCGYCLLRQECCFCSYSPAVWGLQPEFFTTAVSGRPTVGASLHLWPPSLSYPVHTSPARPNTPTFRCIKYVALRCLCVEQRILSWIIVVWLDL